MGWQDNSGKGGGPWGQGPRGSRGRPGPDGAGGGRGTSLDLDDLFDMFRKRLSGSSGGRRSPLSGIPLAGLAGVVVLALWLFTGLYQVNPGQLAVVTTFGKFTRIEAQGLKWHVPYPVQDAEIVDVDAERQTDMGFRGSASNRGREALSESLMLTGDKNIADVTFSVNWNVDTDPVPDGALPGPAKFIFNIENPEKVVRSVAEASMREVVGGNALQPLITSGRDLVEEDTMLLMQYALDSYDSGIRIIRVNYGRADAPPQVREAFLDVFNAGSEAESKINEARRYFNEKIPRARGEARQILENSYAYAARVTEDALGQAGRFNRIYDEYRNAPEVTRQRMYLETIESVFAGMDKVIIDEDAGSGVVPYLPLNELNRSRTGGRE